MTVHPGSRRIVEIDGLRGLAIFLVLIWHYFYFGPDPNHHPAGLIRNLYVHFERSIALGYTGVDLFFVLSGFLIGGILLDNQKSSSYFRTFYVRRFFRIIPIYYAWIFGYILLMWIAGPLLDSRIRGTAGSISWPQMGATFLFIQNLGFVRYAGLASFWFVITWSLAVEEQFYLVSPLAIRLLSRRVLYLLLGLVILTAPLLRVWVHNHLPGSGNLDPAYTLMPCRADGLALGMLAALLWRNAMFREWLSGHRPFLYVMCWIFLAGVAAVAKMPAVVSYGWTSLGGTWIDIFYALLLLLVLEKPGGMVGALARMGWLRELGRVSYCLYIIHVAVKQLCHAFLVPASQQSAAWPVIVVPLVAGAVCYGIARASWTYLEHPLIRRGHRYQYIPSI
ncbi:MAG: acyltransferase family protein [Candidatus Acidiferrales bacterium]